MKIQQNVRELTKKERKALDTTHVSHCHSKRERIKHHYSNDERKHRLRAQKIRKTLSGGQRDFSKARLRQQQEVEGFQTVVWGGGEPIMGLKGNAMVNDNEK